MLFQNLQAECVCECRGNWVGCERFKQLIFSLKAFLSLCLVKLPLQGKILTICSSVAVYSVILADATCRTKGIALTLCQARHCNSSWHRT